jgi:acyl-phosphate glycerol 3-phosphate acyltransferase
MLAILTLMALGYILGSIPTGYWVVKALKGIDIRTIGSGSTGTTNVLRAAGKTAALFVLIVDILKGYFPVLLAQVLEEAALSHLPSGLEPMPNSLLGILVGSLKAVPCHDLQLVAPVVAIAALVGHSKSIFLGFQGGKSAATGLGTLFGLNALAAAETFGFWILLVALTRYVSLASMLGVTACVFFMWAAKTPPSYVGYCVFAMIYVIARHKDNIGRLLKGTEPKLGEKKAVEVKASQVEDPGESKPGQAAGVLLAFLIFMGAPAQAKVVASDTVGLTPEEIVNIRVYKQTNHAVVNVRTVGSSEAVYLNVAPPDSGSGTIITSDGYILTNYHVVERAQTIRITLFDGQTVPARVVGTDPAFDLAILKIEPPKGKPLSVIPFGDSSQMQVGRKVYAIGNPFGLERTLTQGIVSSLGRTLTTKAGRVVQGVIQTDAAINPGNSGGPLLDTSGKMIGITTAIASNVGQSSGIGFAIPINLAKKIVPQLIAKGRVERPDIGIWVAQPTDKGLRVVQLNEKGPAAKAGISGPKLTKLQQGAFTFNFVDNNSADIITSIDNKQVRTAEDLLSYLEDKRAGQTVVLGIWRSGRLVKVPVKLSSGE